MKVLALSIFAKIGFQWNEERYFAMRLVRDADLLTTAVNLLRSCLSSYQDFPRSRHSSITRPAADFRSAVIKPYHHHGRDERNTAKIIVS